MRSLGLLVRVAALLLCALCALQAAPSEPVRVPYASLYRALEPGLVIGKYSALIARQRITSRRADVAPTAIRVRILARAGAINVAVGPQGTVDFPMTQALLAENPFVESNQPKGSLSVSATMELKLDGRLRLEYADVFAAATQAQAALKALGPQMATRTVRSVEFEFPAAANARAELIDAKAEDVLIADDNGLLSVRIDQALLKRKAYLTFSHAPRAARPHID
jgi:hypothetical protein